MVVILTLFRLLCDAVSQLWLYRERSNCYESSDIATPFHESIDIARRCYESADIAIRCYESIDIATRCYESADIATRCYESIDIATRCYESTDIATRCYESEAAAATLFLLSTVCRSALRDRAAGTWVDHPSAYPTEVEMRGAAPPLFTRSFKHSYSLCRAVFLKCVNCELPTQKAMCGLKWRTAVHSVVTTVCVCVCVCVYSSLWSATDCTVKTSGLTM
jgi:hypothetical protein